MKYQHICATIVAVSFFLGSQVASAQASNSQQGENQKALPSHYKPLPKIKEDDIVYHKRIWEDIPLAGENNPNKEFSLFNSKKPLLTVLENGVLDGKIKVYSADDGRFTRELTSDEFRTACITTGGENAITKYMIKEDSLVIKTGERTVRILGIAPAISITNADGTVTDRPLFWIFYPDWRAYLASVPVAGADSWYDIFETQRFVANVTKVSEHPWNKPAVLKSNISK